MEIKLTVDWGRLGEIVKGLSTNLSKNIVEGIHTSAYQIQERWIEKATESNMSDEYIESIDVITRIDGAYIGPSKLITITPSGITEFEKARVGEYISVVSKCPIHKYYREVKRTYKEEEIERFQMPDIVYQNLEVWKGIIRENVRNKIVELIK